MGSVFSPAIPSYNVKEYKLDAARASIRLDLSGDHIAVWTNGVLTGCSVNINDIGSDSIPLDKFNSLNIPAGFKRIYLTTSLQPGKSIFMFIGRAAGAGLGGSANPSSPNDPLADIREELRGIRTIYPCDGKGEPIFFDDFESGTLAKWTDLGGTGSNVPSAANSKRGTFSAKLTGAGVAPTTTGLIHYEANPINGLIGVEYSFTPSSSSTLILLFEVDTSSYGTRFGLKFDTVARQLLYYNNLGGYTLLSAFDYYGDSAWHTLKLVVDTNTRKYIKSVLGRTTYQMTDISGFQLPANSPPKYYISIEADWTAISEDVYVDNVLLTLE